MKIDYKQQSTQKGFIEAGAGAIGAILSVMLMFWLPAEKASAIAALVPAALVALGQTATGVHNILRDETAEKK